MSAGFALAWASRLTRPHARAITLALLFLACGLPPRPLSAAGPASPPPSTLTCASCHAGLAASYAHAAMHNALESPGADPILAAHPTLRTQLGAYSYAVETRDGKSTYTVSDGVNSLTLPIHWIFGQHSQTWVLEKDGDLYESQVSYFQLEQGLATTPGDGGVSPRSLGDAIGRKISIWEVRQCFNCHATNATDGEKLTLDKLRPGLGCERCHEGADRHMVDAARGDFRTLPASLKTMNAEEAGNFCGQCHRTWESAVRNHWHGPGDVRFQPYRLANSRCFSGNDKRISCVACHDPHQPVNTSIASYDAKCLACHAETSLATSSPPAKTCPVAKTNCVTCHMPKVPLPDGHAVFTDHEIRIVRPGAPYPD